MGAMELCGWWWDGEMLDGYFFFFAPPTMIVVCGAWVGGGERQGQLFSGNFDVRHFPTSQVVWPRCNTHQMHVRIRYNT
jgi:hypothetical protein